MYKVAYKVALWGNRIKLLGKKSNGEEGEGERKREGREGNGRREREGKARGRRREREEGREKVSEKEDNRDKWETGEGNKDSGNLYIHPCSIPSPTSQPPRSI